MFYLEFSLRGREGRGLNGLFAVRQKYALRCSTWNFFTRFLSFRVREHDIYTTLIWAKGRYANAGEIPNDMHALIVNVFSQLKNHFIYFTFIGVVWGEGILSWSDLATQSNCSLEIWCHQVLVAWLLGRYYFKFLNFKHVENLMMKHLV